MGLVPLLISSGAGVQAVATNTRLGLSAFSRPAYGDASGKRPGIPVEDKGAGQPGRVRRIVLPDGEWFEGTDREIAERLRRYQEQNPPTPETPPQRPEYVPEPREEPEPTPEPVLAETVTIRPVERYMPTIPVIDQGDMLVAMDVLRRKREQDAITVLLL